MSYNLFLDDLRSPSEVPEYMPQLKDLYKKTDWTVVKSYEEFVNCVRFKGLPRLISMDHDLGDEDELNGYDAAWWLFEHIKNHNINEIPQVVCHSMNQDGKKRIENLINN